VTDGTANPGLVHLYFSRTVSALLAVKQAQFRSAIQVHENPPARLLEDNSSGSRVGPPVQDKPLKPARIVFSFALDRFVPRLTCGDLCITSFRGRSIAARRFRL